MRLGRGRVANQLADRRGRRWKWVSCRPVAVRLWRVPRRSAWPRPVTSNRIASPLRGFVSVPLLPSAHILRSSVHTASESGNNVIKTDSPVAEQYGVKARAQVSLYFIKFDVKGPNIFVGRASTRLQPLTKFFVTYIHHFHDITSRITFEYTIRLAKVVCR